MKQNNILSYWVVEAYDPAIDKFHQVYKSYGVDVANKELYKLLKRGICAVVKHKRLPMI